MQTTPFLFLASLLLGSVVTTPLPGPAIISQRDLSGCKKCMTGQLKTLGITYGVTFIALKDMGKWSTAGATCSLEGKCQKGVLNRQDSGSSSDGNHKPLNKPSEVMPLAAQLRKAKKMVKQDGGATDESS
ncbi:hypothetical protein B0O99DRAFT_597647 [Bisporella sp. PMI_857]|nr:hypothetical protein B0O99DRAFT_597647 [Bisporella sp. PMI_857]